MIMRGSRVSAWHMFHPPAPKSCRPIAHEVHPHQTRHNPLHPAAAQARQTRPLCHGVAPRPAHLPRIVSTYSLAKEPPPRGDTASFRASAPTHYLITTQTVCQAKSAANAVTPCLPTTAVKKIPKRRAPPRGRIACRPVPGTSVPPCYVRPHSAFRIPHSRSPPLPRSGQ